MRALQDKPCTPVLMTSSHLVLLVLVGLLTFVEDAETQAIQVQRITQKLQDQIKRLKAFEVTLSKLETLLKQADSDLGEKNKASTDTNKLQADMMANIMAEVNSMKDTNIAQGKAVANYVRLVGTLTDSMITRMMESDEQQELTGLLKTMARLELDTKQIQQTHDTLIKEQDKLTQYNSDLRDRIALLDHKTQGTVDFGPSASWAPLGARGPAPHWWPREGLPRYKEVRVVFWVPYHHGLPVVSLGGVSRVAMRSDNVRVTVTQLNATGFVLRAVTSGDRIDRAFEVDWCTLPST